MSLPNYLKANIVEELSQNGKIILRVYNDTGGAVTRGVPYVVSPKYVSGEGVIAALAAPATKTTDSNIVGVVVGDLAGATTIADVTYGLFQIAGPFGSLADAFGVPTSGTVAANAVLEVLNAGVAFIDAGIVGGAVLVPESLAVAIELVTTDVWAIYLLGRQAAIKAT